MLCKMSVCLSHTLNQRLQRDAMQDVRLPVTHFESTSTARCYARCPSVCHTLWINVYSVMLCKMSVCLSHTLNQRLQRDAMQDVRLSVTHFELTSTARCYARCPSVCHTLWINVYSVMLCKMSVCLSHTLNQRLQRDAMQDVRLSVTHFESMSTAWCYARCPSVCHILWTNVYSAMLCKMSVCLSHTLNQRLQRDAMQDVCLSVTHFESTSTAWCYARCPSVCHTLWINVYSVMLCKMSVCLSHTLN